MAGIRIAGVVKQSIVDGPGLRLTVFTQGCPHHCPGCHNPQTHDMEGGYICDHRTIVDEIRKNPLLQGITLSGGEPFCQPEELLPLALAAKEMGKNLWIYSGYTYEELSQIAEKNKAVRSLLALTDVLVDGRYQKECRDLNLTFRGSANQRLIDVPSTLQKGNVVELNAAL